MCTATTITGKSGCNKYLRLCVLLLYCLKYQLNKDFLICSFGMCENYFIVTEQPAYLNIPAIVGSRMFGKAGGRIQIVFTDKDEKVQQLL